MQLGVFAKTFPGNEPAGVLAAVRDAGFAVTQFNLACAGLPSMPDDVPAEVIQAIDDAVDASGVGLVALSVKFRSQRKQMPSRLLKPSETEKYQPSSLKAWLK